MKKLLLILSVFAGTILCKGQADEMFDKANALYQQNDFAGAIQLYDSIAALGIANAETYYNLGNAHYRLKNVGLSILNYEKALKLNPTDEDAQHNLALANKQVVDEFNVVPTPALKRIFGDISSVLSSSQWSYLGLAFFVLMLVFAALFLFVNRQSLYITLLLIALLLGAFSEAMAYGKYELETEQFAILTVANSYVKSAPSDGAEDLYILHEGTKVKVLDAFSGWSKIKLPDGKIGWLNADGISAI